MADPQWLEWARQIAAIAQTGKHYTQNPYDHERYEQLEELAAQIIAAHVPTVDSHALWEVFRAERGYGTPKIDVRGFTLNKSNEVLLVREKLDGGKWTLPGGWADVNVTPSENTAREVLEEAGYIVRATRLLAFQDRRLHGHPPTMFHIYKCFFLCDLLNENPVESPQGDLESDEAAWFAEEKLPGDEELSTGRVTHQQLKRFFQMVREDIQVTDFD
jgi:ADP-ribose pyrophosphatase YjhB (NUDIX family)